MILGFSGKSAFVIFDYGLKEIVSEIGNEKEKDGKIRYISL